MSLLNVHVNPERALIAVDTDGLGPAGQHFDICKLYSLAHANVVLAGQGDRRFLLDAFAWICLAEGSVDYDVIVDSMPGMLRRMAAGARAQDAPDVRYSIAVVGFSPAGDRMCGRWYEGSVTSDQVDVHSLGSRVSPWPFEDAPPIPDSEAHHSTLASRQTAWHKANGHAGGGRLIVAELTREVAVIRSVCHLA